VKFINEQGWKHTNIPTNAVTLLVRSRTRIRRVWDGCSLPRASDKRVDIHLLIGLRKLSIPHRSSASSQGNFVHVDTNPQNPQERSGDMCGDSPPIKINHTVSRAVDYFKYRNWLSSASCPLRSVPIRFYAWPHCDGCICTSRELLGWLWQNLI
jgi:hypothetical protein